MSKLLWYLPRFRLTSSKSIKMILTRCKQQHRWVQKALFPSTVRTGHGRRPQETRVKIAPAGFVWTSPQRTAVLASAGLKVWFMLCGTSTLEYLGIQISVNAFKPTDSEMFHLAIFHVYVCHRCCSGENTDLIQRAELLLWLQSKCVCALLILFETQWDLDDPAWWPSKSPAAILSTLFLP